MGGRGFKKDLPIGKGPPSKGGGTPWKGGGPSKGGGTPFKEGKSTPWSLETVTGTPESKPATPQLSVSQTFPAKNGVFTNHFQIQLALKKLEKYTITFKSVSKDVKEIDDDGVRRPRELRACERRSIMLRLLENDLNGTVTWPQYPWVTDYSATVWSVKRFPDDSSLIFRDVDYKLQNGRTSRCAEVHFEHKETMDLSGAPATFNQDSITAVNALVMHHVSYAAAGAKNIRANKFYVRGGFDDFRNGLHAYRGYFTSVRAGHNKLLLNVNTITTPFLAPIRVSDFLLPMRAREQHDQPSLQRILKNVRVRILYNREYFKTSKLDPNSENGRKKVITDFGKSPGQQRTAGPDSQTVAQYFHGLGATITQPNLPCMNTGRPQTSDGKQIWIPAEFLAIEPSQPFRGAMSPDHTTQMIGVAVKLPPENAQRIIREGLPLLGINTSQTSLDKLGLTIAPQLLRVNTKKKATPFLRYRNKVVKVQNAGWNLSGVRFFEPGLVNVNESSEGTQPAISIFHISRPDPGTEKCTTSLSKVMENFDLQFRALGMPGDVMRTDFYDYYPEVSNRGGLSDREYYGKVKTGFNYFYGKAMNSDDIPRHPGPVLVILDSADKLVYSMIKRVADQHGVQAVCTQISKLRKNAIKGDKGFFGNLALKFNIKLGETNHLVLLEKDDKSAIKAIPKSTMVIGADVVHPPSGAAVGFPSITAIVASNGSQCDNFPGLMRLNPARQEIIERLEDMVVERLQAYHDMNKHLSKNILFYRDGVSDGQYAAVSKEEVLKIYSAYQKASRVNKADMSGVKVTFIIVQKRHHTRFNSPETADGNVLPGFVVDTDVVAAEPKNFYLQSHKAVKGTARSAHYVILKNEITEPAAVDTIVDITHGFCYNYQRASKGVSYCGPTYYADRLCDRGYHYVRWLFSDPARAPFQPDPRAENETNEAYARRIAEKFSRHPYWNERFHDRANPWHKDLDNTMFYL